jgi:hypothetical protein
MSRRSTFTLPLLVGLSLFTLSACDSSEPAPLAPAFNASLQAEPPTAPQWHEQARLLVAAARLNPVAAARIYAALAVAQYRAVTEAEPNGSDGTLPDLGYGAGGRDRYESERGAVAGASWKVLSFFFPTQAATLEQRALAAASPHPHFERGFDVGESVAASIIQRVQGDHFTDPWTGTVPTGPGLWINNGPPFLPMLGSMRPYFLTSGSQFRPAAPPAFGSAAFQTDLNEIKQLSSTRTSEQLASAIFWNFPVGTPTPPGYWNQVASGYVTSFNLNERAATHVFALMHAAVMDAAIGCWDAKYHYWCLRPSQADASITLPIGLPNHPAYPSGHSCVSAAAITVLSSFFPGESSDLENRLEQAGLSRMYGGIHYRFDIDAGETIGRSVGQLALQVDRSVNWLPAAQ